MGACCVGEGASEFVTAPGGGTGHSYSYDCNGSRLTNADFASGGSSYANTWDPHNRLSVTTKTSPTSSSTRNVYNASGQRALRVDIVAGVITKTV